MGQVAKENLAYLFILIVPWLFHGTGAVPLTITVGSNPLRTGVGWNTTLSVANGSKLFNLEWLGPAGGTILTSVNGLIFVKPGTQYAGRVHLRANGSLAIDAAVQADEGNYTIKMEPSRVDLTSDSRVINLLVYEQVRNVSVAISTANVLEGQAEVTLTCAVRTGTRLTYSWQKDSQGLSNTSRITISGNVLVIQQLNRQDAGLYTCLVQNDISSGSNTQILTVYYGPESLRIQKDFESDCVAPDLVLQGRSGTVSCRVQSVPPADFTWMVDGQSQHQGSTVNISSLNADQDGNYTCIARNSKTTTVIWGSTNVIAVGYCLSIGGTVGIAIGGAAALILLILLIVFLVRRKRAQKNKPPSNLAPIKASQNGNAKVTSWINDYPDVKRSISPTPIYNTDQVSTYSSYPPSNGSMVASTVDGRASSFYQSEYAGRLSTLV